MKCKNNSINNRPLKLTYIVCIVIQLVCKYSYLVTHTHYSKVLKFMDEVTGQSMPQGTYNFD